jgi:HEAT repeat protein
VASSDPEDVVRIDAVEALGLFGPPAEDALRQAARSDRPAVRQAAEQVLGMRKDSRKFAALIWAAHDKDPAARLRALDRMRGWMRSRRPLPTVGVARRALQDEDPKCRAQAIQLLIAARDTTSFPAIAASADADPEVAHAAIEASRHLGSDGLEMLARAAFHQDERVRKSAISRLAGLRTVDDVERMISHIRKRATGAKSPELLVLLLKYFAEGASYDPTPELIEAGPAAVTALAEMVRSSLSSATCRKVAASVLTRIGGPEAARAIGSSVSGRDVASSCEVAEALGHIGDEQSFQPLQKVVESRNAAPPLRQSAAAALGAVGDGQAHESLVKLLDEDDWHLRFAAAEGLGKLGQNESVAPLVRLLGDPHWRVRQAAATALGTIADRAAAEPLIELLADSHWCVRRSARTALGEISGTDLGPDARHWQQWLKRNR